MHKNRRWNGAKLWYLLNLTPSMKIAVFVDCLGMTPNNIKNKGVMYRKRIREGIEMSPEIPKDFNPEDTPEDIAKKINLAESMGSELVRREIGRTEYEMIIKNNDGEAEIVPLKAIRYRTEETTESQADIWLPARPAKIRLTKRKRIERLGKKLLVFGDSQIGYHRLYDEEGNDYLAPTHSEEALSILTQINAQERPDEIINLSDTVDLAEFGRFDHPSDSLHRTLDKSFQRAHDLYAQLRSDNPDARIVEVDSNHTTRVHKNIMKKMPEMYGFKLPGEKYPLMSYYRLANLEPLGVEFISGYGSAHYLYGEENGAPILFKHGTHSSSSPGATARKEAAQNPTNHVVRGHGHSYEHLAQTTRKGEVLHYMQLGTTCQTTGAVPSYHSSMDDFGIPVKNQENWQQQLMMITDYENGVYQFDVIDIVKGIASYRNRRYDGNE